jgi:hypothetical protein
MEIRVPVKHRLLQITYASVRNLYWENIESASESTRYQDDLPLTMIGKA